MTSARSERLPMGRAISLTVVAALVAAAAPLTVNQNQQLVAADTAVAASTELGQAADRQAGQALGNHLTGTNIFGHASRVCNKDLSKAKHVSGIGATAAFEEGPMDRDTCARGRGKINIDFNYINTTSKWPAPLQKLMLEMAWFEENLHAIQYRPIEDHLDKAGFDDIDPDNPLPDEQGEGGISNEKAQTGMKFAALALKVEAHAREAQAATEALCNFCDLFPPPGGQWTAGDVWWYCWASNWLKNRVDNECKQLKDAAEKACSEFDSLSDAGCANSITIKVNKRGGGTFNFTYSPQTLKDNIKAYKDWCDIWKAKAANALATILAKKPGQGD